MITKSKKEKFGWRCGYNKIYGSFHADNERCSSACRKEYDKLDDAVRAALQHKTHRCSVYVYSNKTGYIGLAERLNFNK